MLANIPNGTLTVHLAIDVQRRVWEQLPEERIQKLATEVRKFADRLRENNIPTLWVVMGNQDTLCADPVAKAYASAKYRLIPNVQEDELIFVKTLSDAFYTPGLEEYLKERGVKKMVISGQQTRFCVADTIEGALACGFSCCGIVNLMADAELPDSGHNNATLHVNVLQAISTGRGFDYYRDVQLILQSDTDFLAARTLQSDTQSAVPELKSRWQKQPIVLQL